MATSSTTRDLRSSRLADEPASLPALLPGIALLALVGYAGKATEHAINTYAKTHHLTFPNIEYVLWAILFGVLISNTVGLPRIFRAGVATYEFWLKAGIILLGARFVLGDVLKLGGISLGLVFVAITLSILFMTWLGRAFRLSPALTTLSPSAPPSAESPPSSRHREPSTPTKTTPLPPSRPSSLSVPSRSSPSPSSATRCTCPIMPTASGPASPSTTPPKPPPPVPSTPTPQENTPSSPRPAVTP